MTSWQERQMSGWMNWWSVRMFDCAWRAELQAVGHPASAIFRVAWRDAPGS